MGLLDIWPLAMVQLGEQILYQLGFAKSNDMLPRWSAHRIAELIERGNSEESPEIRSTVQKEFTDLILKLREHRRQWPDGGPLNRVMPILEKVGAKTAYSYWKKREAPVDWFAGLNELIQLHDAEVNVCWEAITAQIGKDQLEAEIKAAGSVEDQLEDDEKKLLKLLAT